MDGPRTRGGRRSRGVRTRGSRRGGGGTRGGCGGGPGGSPPLHVGGSGRGRGRQERPGPRSADELIICDINALPEDRGLETALHPKKRRTWQPSPQAGPSSAPHFELSMVPSPVMSPQAGPSSAPYFELSMVPSPVMSPQPRPSSAPRFETPSMVPSPAMFQECGDSSPAVSPRTVPRRMPSYRRIELREDDISDILNRGSDDDSDVSDNDEGNIVVPIPRVFQSMLDTPFDRDADDDDEDVVGDIAPSEPVPIDTVEEIPIDVPASLTEHPWGLYEFQWENFPVSPVAPRLRREPFTQTDVGANTINRDPYDLFTEIWDQQVMQDIASETNRYAQQVASQMLESGNLHPRSRIGQWTNTTVDELYLYFGLLLAMGIVVKTRLSEYWNATCDVFVTPGFSAHMSFDRFTLLSKCLHFRNNEDMCELNLDYSEAKLFKIKPIIDHLNRKFQSMYTLAQNIALDESLLMWKGWLDIGQLIPNKAANRGIKTYEICESQTGYLWRFEVHAHKRSQQVVRQSENPLEASTPAIVLNLIKGLENKGYTLWMDNFYNSPCLARHLKSRGFDCVGTLRTDRKFVPQAINNLTKRAMRKGEITGLTSGDVDVMVWRDTNRVAMISTYHGNSKQTVHGSTKPILILDYNIMMGGVDKKDQLLAMFPIERKRNKVWYKKFFKRLLNVSVLNAFVIHRSSVPTSHRDFRKILIKSLLAKHATPSPIPPVPVPATKPDVTHRLAELPMGHHQRMRRACTACKKQIRTFCVGCGKTVCMEPCFLAIHS